MEKSRARFFTPDWIKAVEEEFQTILDNAGDEARRLTFTLSEIYRSAPARVAGLSAGVAAMTVRISDGRVRVCCRPTETFDIRVESVWADAERAVRMVGPDYAAFRDQRIQNGRLRVAGDPTTAPAFLGLVHDAVANRTK